MKLPQFPFQKATDLRGKRVTVLGLGTKGGGGETAKFLLKQKANVTVTDLKTADQLGDIVRELSRKGAKMVLGQHRNEDMIDTDLVIVNPAVLSTSRYVRLAREAGVPVETDISMFFAFCPAPIAAVTGTRGKSTATTVAGQIMSHDRSGTVVAGNIGKSPLAYLGSISSGTPVILELSSWQLEGLDPHEVSPKYALVTTLLPDHLDRYEDFDAYVHAKETIFRYQSSGDALVLSVDDARVSECAERATGIVSWFGISSDASTRGDGVFRKGDDVVDIVDGTEHILLSYSDMSGKGSHTKRNMIAGAALAQRMGARRKSIIHVLKTFEGLPNRLETVTEKNGILFVNDTCATIPEASVSALAVFSNRPVVLIAGGTDKKLHMAPLALALKKRKDDVTLILLKGSATDKLRKELKGTSFTDAPEVDTMEQAVNEAIRVAVKGGVVLLSPGAASFELFADEFDRGTQFCAAVEGALVEEK